MDIIFNIDKNIILNINEIMPNYPILTSIFSFITHLGDAGFIWIIIGIILILKKNTRKNGIIMLVSLAICSIIGNGILKNLFERQRPFIELSLQPFISAPSGFSFPSGHSLISFVGATCVFYTNKKWGILSYIFALLIALSRILLIVHYPSDVIIGSLLGIIISTGVIYIFKNLNTYKLFKYYCNK
ncbi:phosphatase PAP2 family protein [uncultured Tyzzerella sp.]|uniref:phosphatase PAP2 family protein n=1 Tax=uncultured Tyzzerella sp. TaxID=2321398 RepID=UPI00294203CD|nr:phosphatase PAP2 family protein [uncultured Tyzzerella sp.]